MKSVDRERSPTRGPSTPDFVTGRKPVAKSGVPPREATLEAPRVVRTTARLWPTACPDEARRSALGDTRHVGERADGIRIPTAETGSPSYRREPAASPRRPPCPSQRRQSPFAAWESSAPATARSECDRPGRRGQERASRRKRVSNAQAPRARFAERPLSGTFGCRRVSSRRRGDWTNK
jgi:hypothetical protein